MYADMELNQGLYRSVSGVLESGHSVSRTYYLLTPYPYSKTQNPTQTVTLP